jgi:DNA mismatch repair protein MutS
MLSHPGLANRSMEVLDHDGEIVFLRRLKEGSAAESYGLHVARLAGLGEEVLLRASEIMERLKEGEKALRGALPGAALSSAAPPAGAGPTAMPEKAAGPPPHLRRIVEDIAALDLNGITPLDAMNRIQRWKALVDRNEGAKNPGRQSQRPPGPTLFD